MTTQVRARQADAPSEGARSGNLRAALTFLFMGNIFIGSGVLAPAAMTNSMTADLGVTTVDIGALVGWGAVILCIGAPVFSFLTNKWDRRMLLTGALALYAAGHVMSAFVTGYDELLYVRLVMIGGAAIFTPQAASAVALMMPEARRASAVALVFMGWAVAGAAVVPVMSILAETLDWRFIYLVLGIGSALAGLGVMLSVPRGLIPARLSLAAWGGVVTTPPIVLLLAATSLQMSGQFVLYPYLAAELRRVTQADAGGVALVLGIYGAAGLIGSIIATRMVASLGTARTHLVCLACLIAGMAGWAAFAASLPWTAVAMFIWGLGFGAGVAMQQARLIAVAPPLASASVALNTSVLYLGQAMGSATGGALIDGGRPELLGPAGVVFLVVAFMASAWAMRRYKA